MTNLDSILKNRDITLPIKVHIIKLWLLPVVMNGCESWTIKKAECQIDAFKLWSWRRLLRVPWTARRSNQSILWEINPEYSLEGLMLKLKFQYLGHLMWRANSLEKTLMLGKIEGRRRRGQQRMRWLDGIQWTWVWVKSGRWWRTGKPGVLQPMGSQRRTWLSDWATRWWALLFQFQVCSRVSQSFLCVYLFFFKFFSYLDYLEYWAEFSVPYNRSLSGKLVIHKIFLSLTFHGISWKLWTSLCQTVIWKSYRCLHTTLGGSWLIGSPHWEPKLGP